MQARVVITGAGSVSALGHGIDAFAAGLQAGRCAIGRLSLFETHGYRSHFAAQVANSDLPEGLPHSIARRASRSDRFALLAADEALRQAGLDGNAAALGIVMGATTGGMLLGEAYVEKPAASAAALLATPASVTAAVLAHALGCSGPRLTLSTACASGANALGIAADWIRSRRADAVLCGGTDSLCRMTFSGFNALQALDTVPCRPFDRRRAGLSLGEGSAMFVLEAAEHAAARGATILAELVGYGVSADAHHITQPRPDGAGALLAMQRALADAGVAAEEIDYVNAHGTGTPLNDAIETRALKALFGRRAYEVPISSTKSMIGHCLGAAGALEALASMVALQRQFLPPTATLEEPDPECDLDYVPVASRPATIRTVLSNSYGFGGNNSSLVLRAVST